MRKIITFSELSEKLAIKNRKLVLIEALPKKYFDEGHLPEAINLPYDLGSEELVSSLPDKSAEIVVYCSNGPCKNSAILTERLLGLGYRNVVDYHEGKAEWTANRMPLEK